jgi:2-amino-4-hydroxy-6-hydroxymethyldihydropteridine diphosphokinase
LTCLKLAAQDLGALPATALEGCSSWYRSRPLDADGPDYVNGVLALQTALGPHELLRAMLDIERQHDRQRPYRHAPRTLDLDLLAHGGLVLDTATLTLPHPRMTQRAFVLCPLNELLATLGGTAAAPELPQLPDAQACDLLAATQGVTRIPLAGH